MKHYAVANILESYFYMGMSRRLFWVQKTRSRNMCMLFVTLMIIPILVPLLKNLLTGLMNSNEMLAMERSLITFNGSIQSMNIERTSDPVLIFTCLGSSALSKHQTYIWQSMTQARIVNPSIKMVLILSKQAFKSNVARKLKKLNITPEINDDLISNETLIQDFRRIFFIEDPMEPGGNKEFAQFTLERLLSIYIYMKKNDQVHVFHIENDNMLYVDLYKLNKRMKECRVSLAVPKAAKNIAVVSFMYIRSFHALEQLVEWCVRVFHLGRNGAIKFMKSSFINDMTLTARYLDLLGSTNEQSKTSGVYVLQTEFVDKAQECCLCFLESKPIIFDACVLGQYFGGTYAKPNVSHWEPTRLMDPRNETLSWRYLNSQIKIPYIKNQRIANIHVHSKRLEKFSSLGDYQTTGFTNNNNKF